MDKLFIIKLVNSKGETLQSWSGLAKDEWNKVLTTEEIGNMFLGKVYQEIYKENGHNRKGVRLTVEVKD